MHCYTSLYFSIWQDRSLIIVCSLLFLLKLTGCLVEQESKFYSKYKLIKSFAIISEDHLLPFGDSQ